MSKSKSVKIPLEVLELLEKRKPVDDRAPGEQLLEIVREYMELERYAKAMKEQIDLESDLSVSEAIMEYLKDSENKTASMIKDLDELKTMIKGLQVFFTRIKGK